MLLVKQSAVLGARTTYSDRYGVTTSAILRIYSKSPNTEVPACGIIECFPRESLKIYLETAGPLTVNISSIEDQSVQYVCQKDNEGGGLQ